MKAVGKYVVVEMLKDEETSQGGVLLGKKDFTRYKKGKLVSIHLDVGKPGDEILFDSSNSHDVVIDGEKYRIIECSNIAVIL